MNYYPFHVGDYASATRHLTWEEDCAFRRLLDVYYVNEKPLPSEISAVCRLVVAVTEEQREAVKVVLEEFFILTAEGWVNERADEELDAMRAKQQMAKDKANKRWDMQRQERSIASALPQHEESNAAADATASNSDAEAMLPTPTPIPNKEHIKTKTTRSARFGFLAALIAKGVPESVASDFLETRKAKKLAPTQTAFNGIAKEVEKSGLAFSAAIDLCCRKGWGGFDSSWVKPEDRLSVVASSDPNEMVTLPDGRKITRQQQQWLQRMMA